MKPINPNDFGEKIIVDQCQKIDITDLLREYREQLKAVSLTADMFDVPVLLATSETRFGGVRYWFSCPLCTKRVGIIYQHPISSMVGCRTCLNLDYRKRRYKGMAEDCLPEMSEG